MKAAILSAAIFLAAAAAVFAEPQNEGAALFEVRCTICHQIPDPAMLKPAQWDAVLAVMQKRIAQKGLPPLPEDEIKEIREFLHNNARR